MSSSRQSSISSTTGPSLPLIDPQLSPELVHVNDADFPNVELDFFSDCYAPCLSSVHALLTCYLFHQITAYVYYRPTFPPYRTSLGLSRYLDT